MATGFHLVFWKTIALKIVVENIVVLIYQYHIDIIDMRWHIEIAICILNIAIFFDISLKNGKKVNYEGGLISI